MIGPYLSQNTICIATPVSKSNVRVESSANLVLEAGGEGGRGE